VAERLFAFLGVSPALDIGVQTHNAGCLATLLVFAKITQGWSCERPLFDVCGDLSHPLGLAAALCIEACRGLDSSSLAHTQSALEFYGRSLARSDKPTPSARIQDANFLRRVKVLKCVST